MLNNIQHELNMTRSTVVKINQTLYVRVPAEEARRMNLREGQAVEIQVKVLGATLGEVIRDLRGKYKGQFANIPDEELWGEP